MDAEARIWIENEEGDGGGSTGAGQAGDTQDLSTGATEAEESVEDLVETGQAFEAGIVEGLEDAAEHAERPVTTHEDQRQGAGGLD